MYTRSKYCDKDNSLFDEATAVEIQDDVSLLS